MSRVWRVSTAGRLGGLLVPLILGGLWFGLRGPAAGLLVLAAGVASWLVAAVRPAVILTGEEVIVRNPLGTRRIRLVDVTAAAPGYGGVTITTRNGAKVTAWAVQKSNLATWTNRRTRADDVAAAINSAAAAGNLVG